MQRMFSVLLLVLLVGAVVWATGQGEAKPSGEVSGKIVAMLGNGQDLDTLRLEHFHKQYPNVQVEYVPAPQTSVIRREKYVTMFAAQDGSIDVVLMNTVDTGEFASSKWILALDKYVNVNQIKDLMYPSFYNAATWEGKLYGIPLTADTLDFYWRKDLLEGAGMKPPTVWSDFVQQAAKLQTPERFGLVASWERGNQIFCQLLLFLASNGGDVMTKDLSKVTIDTPGNAEALQLMADMIAKYKIAPKDVLSLTVDNGRIVFNEGRAVFNLNWDYGWNRYQTDESPIKGKVGAGTAPSFPGKPQVSVLGGWNAGVNAFSKNQATAVAFVKSISDDEMSRIQVLHPRWAQTSPNKKAMSDPEYVAKNPEFIKALADNYAKAVARPVTPAYAEITEVISQEIMPALYGERGVKEALSATAAKISAIMK
jgi:multiple sugar transport system substrate-binding protein